MTYHQNPNPYNSAFKSTYRSSASRLPAIFYTSIAIHWNAKYIYKASSFLNFLSSTKSITSHQPRRSISLFMQKDKPAAPSFLSKLCCFMLPKKAAEKPSLLLLPSSSSNGEFKQVFHYLDEDGDGKISPVELRNCMKIVGEEVTEEEVKAIVVSSDTDGDGLLAFEEFVRLVGGQGEEEKFRNLMEAFKMYEMEGKGCITPKSLKRALGRLGECKTTEECQKMIRRFDLNGDGVISFEEFRVMLL